MDMFDAGSEELSFVEGAEPPPEPRKVPQRVRGWRRDRTALASEGYPGRWTSVGLIVSSGDIDLGVWRGLLGWLKPNRARRRLRRPIA